MESQLEKLRKLVPQYESQGQQQLAVELCKETLHALKKAKGDDHQDVAEVLNILAQVYYSQNQFEDAADRTKDALKIYETVFGPKHLTVAEILINLGDSYYQLKNLEEADSAFYRAILIKREILGERHLEVGAVLYKLAYVCTDQKEYDKAEFYLKETLKIFESPSNLNILAVGNTKLKLGNLYMEKRNFKKAEETIKEALRRFESMNRPDDANIAKTKHTLAICCGEQDRYLEAEQYLIDAVKIFESRRQNDHLANSLSDLGNCYFYQDKFEAAQYYYEMVLKIRRMLIKDPNYLQQARTLQKLATCMVIQKEFRDAERALREALEIYAKHIDKIDETIIADVKNQIAFCLAMHKGAEGLPAFIVIERPKRLLESDGWRKNRGHQNSMVEKTKKSTKGYKRTSKILKTLPSDKNLNRGFVWRFCDFALDWRWFIIIFILIGLCMYNYYCLTF